MRFLLTGHVDHGKSTLGGHLLYLCGAIEERDKEKTFTEASQDKMSAFKWARLLDINAEERERGLTVEANEVEFKYMDNNYMLIDTPGHKLFIPNLIDAVFRNQELGIIGVLVLSALPNEIDVAIQHGQTKEDVTILRALGVTSLVVAINKLDKLSWSREAYDNARNKILPFLQKARFSKIEFTATSGFEGKGLIDKSPLENPPDSLIDSIRKCYSDKTISNIEQPVTTDTFQVEIFVLNCPILSAGYSGIIHLSNGESSFEVDKILKDPKSKRHIRFLKTGQKGKLNIKIPDRKDIRKGERVLFRRDSNTVAFGIITEVFPLSKK